MIEAIKSLLSIATWKGKVDSRLEEISKYQEELKTELREVRQENNDIKKYIHDKGLNGQEYRDIMDIIKNLDK